MQKVDIIDVVTHIKKPLTVIYISCIKLILLPIIVYFVLIKADPTIQMSLFLLAALPTGVTSALFTDIMNGRTSLNLTIVIITNLLSIFSMSSEYKIKSFTYNFKDNSKNNYGELDFAKKISSNLKLKNYSSSITPEYIKQNIDKLVLDIESPFTSIRLFGVKKLYQLFKRQQAPL